jgi:hypothetical protein
MFGTLAGNPSFYPAMSYFFSQFPYLSSVGITSYNTVSGNTSLNGTNYGGFQGNFMLPVLSPQNTSASLTAALAPLFANISSTYPNQFIFQVSNVTSFPTFYDWWLPSNGPNYAGVELVVGSRLISGDVLHDTSAVETYLKGVLPASAGGQSLNFYLLGGKGVADAKPRGGSDAVNPAWRRGLIHAGSYPLPPFQAHYMPLPRPKQN